MNRARRPGLDPHARGLVLGATLFVLAVVARWLVRAFDAP